MPNTFKTELKVIESYDNTIIRNGEILKGVRVEGIYMSNYIRVKYRHVGIAECVSIKKPINIYADKNGLIYGLSKILSYRYFILDKGS